MTSASGSAMLIPGSAEIEVDLTSNQSAFIRC
jgi:hypothetical protein